MATGNVSRVIRAPGKLIIDPTDDTWATDPYGGTEIGKSRQCSLFSLSSEFRVEYEALGEWGDILEPANYYIFGCFLRGWDDDAVQQCMTGYAAGTTSKHATWSVPGATTPGESAYDARQRIFLYVPDDIIHTPALLMYAGIPMWTDGAQMAFQRKDELGIPLTILCMRDSNNNLLSMGRLADLSLT